MEEFQEADVLWPDTPPPPSRDRELYLPELYEATAADFSCESFGSDMSGPASSSSSSASSSAPAFGPASSDGFLSVPSTFAGGHGGDDASFQEADVLWPDDGYVTRERGVDGGELWWLCCGFGGDAAPRSPPLLGVNAERGGRLWCHLRSTSLSELPPPHLAVVAVLVQRR